MGIITNLTLSTFDPSPTLPRTRAEFKYPFRNIRQQVKVQWNTYRLEIRRGAVMVCSVQIFLMRAGLYMVEFMRGQLDIFQFKRFYEDIRVRLSAVVKNDYALRLLDGAAPSRSLR